MMISQLNKAVPIVCAFMMGVGLADISTANGSTLESQAESGCKLLCTSLYPDSELSEHYRIEQAFSGKSMQDIIKQLERIKGKAKLVLMASSDIQPAYYCLEFVETVGNKLPIECSMLEGVSIPLEKDQGYNYLSVHLDRVGSAVYTFSEMKKAEQPYTQSYLSNTAVELLEPANVDVAFMADNTAYVNLNAGVASFDSAAWTIEEWNSNSMYEFVKHLRDVERWESLLESPDTAQFDIRRAQLLIASSEGLVTPPDDGGVWSQTGAWVAEQGVMNATMAVPVIRIDGFGARWSCAYDCDWKPAQMALRRGEEGDKGNSWFEAGWQMFQ